jgi:hypothetical protein
MGGCKIGLDMNELVCGLPIAVLKPSKQLLSRIWSFLDFNLTTKKTD